MQQNEANRNRTAWRGWLTAAVILVPAAGIAAFSNPNWVWFGIAALVALCVAFHHKGKQDQAFQQALRLGGELRRGDVAKLVSLYQGDGKLHRDDFIDVVEVDLGCDEINQILQECYDEIERVCRDSRTPEATRTA